MEFTIKTSRREEIIDITKEVEELIRKTKEAGEGKACIIFTPHTTCSIIINEISDKNLCEDLLEFLRQKVVRGKWRHDSGEGNADSHIKASLLGNCKVIPLEKGKLMLGRWQGIGLTEFDGPRERKVIVKIV